MNLPPELFGDSTLKIGDQAPDFVLKTESETHWRLSEQYGKVTALLFYPQNETLVCTKQLCSVRDHWLEYLETKAVIVGISPGTVSQNGKFSKKHRLPLPILADTDCRVTKLFGQHWILPVRLTRAIVVIDANGLIRSRNILLRAFRPRDKSVIASIYAARTDFLQKHISHLISESKERNKEHF